MKNTLQNFNNYDNFNTETKFKTTSNSHASSSGFKVSSKWNVRTIMTLPLRRPTSLCSHYAHKHGSKYSPSKNEEQMNKKDRHDKQKIPTHE